MNQLLTSRTSPAREIHEHLTIDLYGDFRLTPAIRPSLDLQVVPKEGYRIEEFRDDQSGGKIPMIAASVSMERLFDVFLDLLDCLGPSVDVILESHHDRKRAADPPRDFVREHVDLPVLKSYFWEHQDSLIEDGCLSVAIVDPRLPCEIQFDDHKVFVVYARDLTAFSRALEQAGIERDDSLKLISEGEHLHSTSPGFADRFERLKNSLSAC